MLPTISKPWYLEREDWVPLLQQAELFQLASVHLLV